MYSALLCMRSMMMLMMYAIVCILIAWSMVNWAPCTFRLFHIDIHRTCANACKDGGMAREMIFSDECFYYVISYEHLSSYERAVCTFSKLETNSYFHCHIGIVSKCGWRWGYKLMMLQNGGIMSNECSIRTENRCHRQALTRLWSVRAWMNGHRTVWKLIDICMEFRTIFFEWNIQRHTNW